MEYNGEFQAELEEWAKDLRRLRIEHGGPTLAHIAARAPKNRPLSPSGVSEILSGKRLPTYDFYMALVRVLLACDGRPASYHDERLAEWRERWQRLKELETEQKNRRKRGGRDAPVAGRSLAPDGGLAARVMLSALSQGRGVEISPLQQEQWVGNHAVAFSPDGRVLAVDYHGRVRLWHLTAEAASWDDPAGELGKRLNHFLVSLAFSPDGGLLAAGSSNGTTWLWDMHTRTRVSKALTGQEGLRTVVFAPDGHHMVTAGKTLRVWDVTDPAHPRRVGKRIGAGYTATATAFSPSGRLAVASGEIGRVRLWEVADGEDFDSEVGRHRAPVTAMAFSSDGRYLATGSEDTTVRLWDAATRKESGSPLAGHSGPVTTVAFSPDGQYLATASEDTTVQVWDTTTNTRMGEPLKSHTAPVTTIAYSPDSRLLVTGGGSGVRLWVPPVALDRGRADGAWHGHW
ncbi:hypothetical protein ACFVT2_35900 [Streptomyces sp. NPDC058000]|uniref:hypothetical protein n=1 Tax=Streptomyces sp. NPDC058000 TaxID=3346299 RepID=UPI0036ED2E5A